MSATSSFLILIPRCLQRGGFIDFFVFSKSYTVSLCGFTQTIPVPVVEKAIVAEKAKEHLEGNKSYKERTIEAIKLGGLAAFEKAIDHPIAAFFVEAIKSWFDKN